MDGVNDRELTHSIVVDGVSKSFGKYLALQDGSMEMKEGEAFGLLGPNGAGKTTLLNILCGLSVPTEGRVTFLGMTYRDHHDDIRRLLGYVAQETALYDHLTAEENLMFHARFYGVPSTERKSRVEKALELAQLQDRRKSKVKTFSGGMRRRLAIVRALIHDPRVLMLDEPSLGIDVQSRMEIWDRIREMRGTKTVIVTTNYMEEADYLCDRVAILDEGRVVALDSPEALKKAHLGEVVELSLQDPPRAFLDGLGQLFAGVAESQTVEELPEKGPGWVKLSLRVRDASSKLGAIVDTTRGNGVDFREVNVRAPSLNDVFIEMTGKRLRD